MDECGKDYQSTLNKLNEVARQFGCRPNRRTLLMIKDQVLGPNQNRFQKPDRVALRYPQALVWWFWRTPNWTDYVFDPVKAANPVNPVNPVALDDLDDLFTTIDFGDWFLD
jgi:hypothetical protein